MKDSDGDIALRIVMNGIDTEPIDVDNDDVSDISIDAAGNLVITEK